MFVAAGNTVISSPNPKLPADFPGTSDERRYPQVVCTCKDIEWANFIAYLLNDEYRSIQEEEG